MAWRRGLKDTTCLLASASAALGPRSVTSERRISSLLQAWFSFQSHISDVLQSYDTLLECGYVFLNYGFGWSREIERSSIF